MIRHSRHHHVDSALVYGFAVLSVIFLANIHTVNLKIQKKVAPEKVDIVSRQIFFKQDNFSNIAIRGKAYVVYDIVDQKIIAGKNENMMLPLASITKVMTVFTARMHYDKKKKIAITPASIEGSYDIGLHKGQTFDLDELLKYTLVFSSNDGAQAIADGLGGRQSFVSHMNQDASGLGLPLTFTHPAGLDEGDRIGGKGSALSVAKLVAVAEKHFPEIFDVTTKTKVSVLSSTGKIIGVPNTNQKVNHFSGIEMSKTGFTDKAGGNLVIIVNVMLGRPVAIVVLGSTKEERFSDMELLYQTLQKSLIQ